MGGFTLIELLVVVLIIGILAAIALPMYNKATERSKAAQAQIWLRSAADAVDRLKMERPRDEWNGYAFTNNDIDIDLPELKDFSCSMEASGIGSIDFNVMRCTRVIGGNDAYELEIAIHPDDGTRKHNCFPVNDDTAEKYNALCNSLGYTVEVEGYTEECPSWYGYGVCWLKI